jgi:ketosteroid isomerase-like protein
MFDEDGLGMEGGDTEARQRADLVFGVWNDEGLEAMAERFWHPEIVWEEPPDFPDADVHRGRDKAVQRMNERLELLGHIQIDVLDARRVGPNTLVEVVLRGTGSASGAPVERREYFLLTIEDRRTTRFREYLDRDAAVAAAEADS